MPSFDDALSREIENRRSREVARRQEEDADRPRLLRQRRLAEVAALRVQSAFKDFARSLSGRVPTSHVEWSERKQREFFSGYKFVRHRSPEGYRLYGDDFPGGGRTCGMITAEGRLWQCAPRPDVGTYFSAPIVAKYVTVDADELLGRRIWVANNLWLSDDDGLVYAQVSTPSGRSRSETLEEILAKRAYELINNAST